MPDPVCQYIACKIREQNEGKIILADCVDRIVEFMGEVKI